MRRVNLLIAVLLALAPALSSLQARADEVAITFDGLQLNATLEKTARWPAGITLLVTHGTLSHKGSEIIRTLQALFLEEDVSSLAINLSLGENNRQGPFDCQAVHAHRHTDAIAELAAWLGWLEQHGVNQVVAVGHSRGANQTAGFTLETGSPLLVAQVLLAPPAEISSPVIAGDGQGDPALANALANARTQMDNGQVDTLYSLPRFLYCKDAQVTAGSLVSYYGNENQMDTRVLLRHSSIPTLVFVGSEDQTTPGLDEAYASLDGDARLQLVVVDGADHYFRDLYADEVVETVLDFLKDLPGD